MPKATHFVLNLESKPGVLYVESLRLSALMWEALCRDFLG